MAFTDQKRLFADKYLEGRCRNGAEAARQAGYSEKAAKETACRLLKEPDVREYIDEKLAEARLSANEVLSLLSDQANASLEDFVDIGLDDERIARLEEDLAKYEEKALDIKLHDKVRDFAMSQVKEIKAELGRLYDRDYRINLIKAKDRGKLHLIKALKPSMFGLSIELHDAHAALVDMGRHHKLFTDNLKHDFSHVSNEELLNIIEGGIRGGGEAGADLGESREVATPT